MQIEDIQALFGYLRVLHPNCPPDKVPKLTRTRAQEWIAAAEGYSRDQLFQAAREHAQTCRFWPDLSEILARLPPLAQGEAAVRPARPAGGGEYGQTESVAGGVAPGAGGDRIVWTAGGRGPRDEPWEVECAAPGDRRVGGCPWLTRCA